MSQTGSSFSTGVLRLKRFLHGRLRRLGLDIVRYRSRLAWPEETNRFVYQKEFIQFDIAPGSVVLDIGSGHYPFPLATILADLYIGDSPHRTEEIIRDHRPLLVLDVGYLPFRNKSIDFAYCSHVLEHVDDPKKACSELMRVGRRGYIETPGYAKDLLYGWALYANHKWHVVAINRTLYFFEYTERQRRGLAGSAWKQLLYGPAYHPIQEAYWRSQDLFNTMFLWDDRFDCVVCPLNRKDDHDVHSEQTTN